MFVKKCNSHNKVFFNWTSLVIQLYNKLMSFINVNDARPYAILVVIRLTSL